jgi:hypothetical protein
MKILLFILCQIIFANSFAQVIIKIINKEINSEQVNVICNYSTYKNLAKFKNNIGFNIDTNKLLGVEISHIGYKLTIISNFEIKKDTLNIALVRQTKFEEAVVVRNKKKYTKSNLKFSNLHGYLADISGPLNASYYFEVQLPKDLENLYYIEHKAHGLKQYDTVLCNFFNTEIDILNNTPSFSKSVIILKDNLNLILTNDNDAFDLNLENANYYCLFLVKHYKGSPKIVRLRTELKENPSTNYLIVTDSNKIFRGLENDFSNLPRKNVHLSYKIKYTKKQK